MTRTKSASSSQTTGTPPQSGTPAVPKPVVADVVPVIAFFDQDARSWLHVGEMIRVSMQGTPGGQASFQITGIGDSFPMQETSPGQYIGRWARPGDGNLPQGMILINGKLTVQGKAAPPVQAARPILLDSVPPVLSNPLPQATVSKSTPTFSVEFKDEGSGVDINSVRFIIDGRDYTGEANISSDHLQFRPVIPFPAGAHAAEVSLTDMAGNRAKIAWNFTISK